MTEENWVKLPEPAPKTLPAQTFLRYPQGVLWCAQEELTLVGEREYRGELTRGVHTVAGATFETLLVELPPGYRFEGSEVVKDCCERKAMAEAGGVEHVCLGVDPAVPGSERTVFVVTPKSGKSALLKEYEAQMSGKPSFAARLREAVQAQMTLAYQQQGGLGLSDYVFRQGDYQQQGQLQYGTCPECSQQCWIQLSQVCAACGATARSIEAKRSKPACSCGAMENTRLEWGDFGKTYQCGPCYQARRRAELQAQKLEQTKRAMNRPVKRDPYEWLGFSSADWEE